MALGGLERFFWETSQNCSEDGSKTRQFLSTEDYIGHMLLWTTQRDGSFDMSARSRDVDIVLRSCRNQQGSPGIILTTLNNPPPEEYVEVLRNRFFEALGFKNTERLKDIDIRVSCSSPMRSPSCFLLVPTQSILTPANINFMSFGNHACIDEPDSARNYLETVQNIDQILILYGCYDAPENFLQHNKVLLSVGPHSEMNVSDLTDPNLWQKLADTTCDQSGAIITQNEVSYVM